MRKTTWMAIAAVGLALGAASAEAQYYGGGGGDNAFRFRVGMFTPQGESDYWLDNELVFGGQPDDFEDMVLGADFRFGLGSRLGLIVSGDVFEGEDDLAYLEFRDELRNDLIFHTTALEVSSLTAGLVLNLTPPDAPLVPYVGAGGGFYRWTLAEDGDFIDFEDPLGPTIFTARFEDEGEVLGWYWLAGVEVPVGPQWSLFAEGRWHNAEDELSGDFTGLGDLDLSGRQISGGASWRF